MPGRKRRFCSSVPKRTTTSHITELLPITPASPNHPFEISSNTMAKVVLSMPAPPYSSGIFKPNSPICFIWATSSCGYSLRCSISEATGITSFATNFRTVLTINSCSTLSACTLSLLALRHSLALEFLNLALAISGFTQDGARVFPHLGRRPLDCGRIQREPEGQARQQRRLVSRKLHLCEQIQGRHLPVCHHLFRVLHRIVRHVEPVENGGPM